MHKACLIYLFLIATCFSQQSNSDGSTVFVEQLNPSVLFGAGTFPGPHTWTIPQNNGQVRIWTIGRPGQLMTLFGSPGSPVVGALNTPGGIVDLNVSNVTVLYSLTLSGTWNGCTTAPFCATAGTGLPINYSPGGPISFTTQALTNDPVSPVGYTLSAAIWVNQ